MNTSIWIILYKAYGILYCDIHVIVQITRLVSTSENKNKN